MKTIICEKLYLEKNGEIFYWIHIEHQPDMYTGAEDL